MKKLFVIMTLVLCMVLTTLPVFANPAAGTANEPNPAGEIVNVIAPSICNLETAQVDFDDIQIQKCLKKTCTPVFLATVDLCNGCTLTTDNFINEGAVDDWFDHYAGMDFVAMAKAYWAQSKFNRDNGGAYVMAYPFIRNIGKMHMTFDAIKYTTTKGDSDSIIAYENAKKDTATAQQAYDAQKKVVDGLEKSDPTYYDELKKLDQAEAKLDKAKADEKAAKEKAEKLNTVKEIVKVDADALVIVVEPGYRQVKIKHIFNINGKETVYLETQEIPVEKVLTAANMKDFAKVTAMDGETKVALDEKKSVFIDAKQPSMKLQDFVYGDYGYVLYYTAAKAGEKNVDAAKAVKTDANVAGATNAKALPATGVAETLPMLSAALLVLVGLVVVKKH